MTCLGPRFLLVDFLFCDSLMRHLTCLRVWLIHPYKKETEYPSQTPDQIHSPTGRHLQGEGIVFH